MPYHGKAKDSKKFNKKKLPSKIVQRKKNDKKDTSKATERKANKERRKPKQSEKTMKPCKMQSKGMKGKPKSKAKHQKNNKKK